MESLVIISEGESSSKNRINKGDLRSLKTPYSTKTVLHHYETRDVDMF